MKKIISLCLIFFGISLCELSAGILLDRAWVRFVLIPNDHDKDHPTKVLESIQFCSRLDDDYLMPHHPFGHGRGRIRFPKLIIKGSNTYDSSHTRDSEYFGLSSNQWNSMSQFHKDNKDQFSSEEDFLLVMYNHLIAVTNTQK